MTKLISNFRNKVYNSLFCDSNPVSTIYGYYSILQTIPNNSTILDVGCGNGIYFTNDNVIKIIKSKNINIKCIDIDKEALIVCNNRVNNNNISNLVNVEHIDFLLIENNYDYIFFIESYPVIDDKLFKLFLNHASNITTNIIMFHNLEDNYDYLLSTIKPLIKYFTLVDFGKLTTKEDFKKILNNYNYNMRILHKAKYKDINIILKYIPFYRNHECKQYMIHIQL